MSLEIFGNSEPVRLVEEMISKHHEPHSIVIYGEKGLGKKQLAKYISAALLCEKHSGKPCGKCRTCKMIDEGVHPDVMTVVSNSNGNYIVDEAIRPIVSDAQITPTEADIKVYIIPDLDLSVSTSVQVQNILLKLIEEPPAHVAIILTAANKEAFLPTIISRVLPLGVSSVSEGESTAFLRKNHSNVSEADICEAVSAGRGNIGRCEEYLSGGAFKSSAETAKKLAAATVSHDEYAVCSALCDADGKRSELHSVIQLYSEIVRDACFLRLGNKEPNQLVSCDISSAARLGNMLSAKACTALYDLLCKYEAMTSANVNHNLLINGLSGQINSVLNKKGI